MNVLSGDLSEVTIGMNDMAQEGTYVWTDGTTNNYDLWGDADPDQQPGDGDMVRIKKDGSRKWMDGDTQAKYPFMCATDTCPPGQLLQNISCVLKLNCQNNTPPLHRNQI